MKEIYRKLIESLEEKSPSILSTIIVQKGSVPRGRGTQFLIKDDGFFVGTIGGGRLEAQVLEQAKEVFETRSPARLNFVLKGTDVEKTDMLCGGDAEVFLEFMSPEKEVYAPMFRRALHIKEQGDKAIMATVVDPSRWEKGVVPKVLIEKSGQTHGSLAGEDGIEETLREKVEEVLRKGQGEILVFKDREGKDLEVFVEPIVSEPRLFIFGGGHVSEQIVPFAARVGFEVFVIDDRKEFARRERFPEAAQVLEYPFDGVMGRVPVDASSYIVIVTRGHMHDRTVLEQALKTPAKYIGMIGSRRKRNIIYKKLLEEGFTQEDVKRVHAPVGLDIGAETPEEIAVSIVAELIKVRAGLEGE
ncbi:MAG: XdhC family protein [Deltaproteobacteria bacterium]|nr:XdhC family protein [Deltaproteobacteria bacterium]MBW2138586.1 XdhC family protein [Deltaproteobacteria bacterium]